MDEEKHVPCFYFWNPNSGFVGGAILGFLISILIWFLPEILDFFEINY